MYKRQDIIYVLDLAARQLIYLNRNELLGYTRAELQASNSVSYTHLRAHETVLDLVCRLLLEKKKTPTHTYPLLNKN